MPGTDHTGPLSQGPMTGRGRGYCMVEVQEGMDFSGSRGMGLGRSAGRGLGMGRSSVPGRGRVRAEGGESAQFGPRRGGRGWGRGGRRMRNCWSQDPIQESGTDQIKEESQ